MTPSEKSGSTAVLIEENTVETQADVGNLQATTSSSFEMSYTPSCLDSINKWLEVNMESPIDFKKLKSQVNYPLDQLDKIYRVLCACAGKPIPDTPISTWQMESTYFKEIINQLKEFISSPSCTVQDKLRAVSVLPKSLPTATCKAYLENVSKRFVRNVKGTVDEKGILCSADKKTGRPLDSKTVEAVQEFFYRQDVSKELAGKNNTVSVKENGTRVLKRKRLLLGNVLDFHQEFLKAYPDHQISLSKFASLRPKECVLANSAGMHNVCVCVYHENPKLMFKGARLNEITHLKSATECLGYIVCSEPTPECWLRMCPNCPDWTTLRTILEDALDQELFESITVNQWAGSDRGELNTLTFKIEDFIDKCLQQIEDLATHHFVFKAQAEFFISKQSELTEREVLVVGDYAQNFEFVIQDSIQSAYFQAKQATVHPFSIY